MRIRNCSLLFLFFLPLFVFAQKGFNHGEIKFQKEIEEIPFRILSGFIIIDVEFNGKNENFIFDTGAQNVYFDQLESRKTSNVKIYDSNRKNNETSIAYQQSFKIADLEFANQAFVISTFENNYVKDCLKVVGIIGSNAVRNVVVKIDYQNNKLILARDIKHISIENYQVYEMFGKSKNHTYPYVELMFSGDKNFEHSYLLDTGFNSAIDVSQDLYDKLTKNNGVAAIENGIGIGSVGLFGAGASKDMKRFNLKKPISIGGLVTENFTFGVNPDKKSKMGYEVMRKLNPIIDFKKEKVYFSKEKSTLRNPERNRVVGIFYQDNKTVVASLWGDYMDKSSVGDEVLKVNQKEMEISSFCDILMKNHLENLKTMTLKNKEGKIYELSFD